MRTRDSVLLKIYEQIKNNVNLGKKKNLRSHFGTMFDSFSKLSSAELYWLFYVVIVDLCKGFFKIHDLSQKTTLPQQECICFTLFSNKI